MFCQIIGKIDDADTERPASHRAIFCCDNRVILIIEQSIQCTDSQCSQFFQLIERIDRPQIESRQGTERNFTVFVIDVI